MKESTAHAKSQCACRVRSGIRRGFTLIELLVVIAVIGILVGLTMPAVQSVRRAARKTVCQNNLRQMGLALHNYHAAHGTFPPGATFNSEHSWCTEILPFIEGNQIHINFDFSIPWNVGTNLPLSQTNLEMFICPSGKLDFPGKTDYGGIIGSSLTGMTPGTGPNQAFGSGVLPAITDDNLVPVRVSQIDDGTTHTIMVGECVDRDETASGFWAARS